ncbi:hypothetical protein C0J52_07766 [Blattella germanica]|nr:hypothetical protein C0J52_07766 [Blattella germanica]
MNDVFTWDGLFDLTEDTQQSQQRDNEPGDLVERSCACEGPSCNCCLDFNLTYIDLGGPGCVRMKYLSPTDGIAVNVSYGAKLLHSELVKDLAQLCARFSDLAPTSDGLRWCLQFEPTLLGDVQAQYQVGCFRMGPSGMSVDPPIANTTEISTETPVTSTPTPEELNEEALIAAVNESAEEGIAFFTNLLGINFGGSGEILPNATDTTNTTETTSTSTTLSTENPTGEQTRTS